MTKTTEKIWTILQQTIGEDAALHLIETAQAEIRRDTAEDIVIDIEGEDEAIQTIKANYL